VKLASVWLASSLTKQWTCAGFQRQPSSSWKEMVLTMFLHLPRILTLQESVQRSSGASLGLTDKRVAGRGASTAKCRLAFPCFSTFLKLRRNKRHYKSFSMSFVPKFVILIYLQVNTRSRSTEFHIGRTRFDYRLCILARF
jgi:hypothetical protein